LRPVIYIFISNAGTADSIIDVMNDFVNQNSGGVANKNNAITDIAEPTIV